MRRSRSRAPKLGHAQGQGVRRLRARTLIVRQPPSTPVFRRCSAPPDRQRAFTMRSRARSLRLLASSLPVGPPPSRGRPQTRSHARLPETAIRGPVLQVRIPRARLRSSSTTQSRAMMPMLTQRRMITHRRSRLCGCRRGSRFNRIYLATWILKNSNIVCIWFADNSYSFPSSLSLWVLYI